MVSTKVQVPTGMGSEPFDADRSLNVPSGFSVSVYARMDKPRFMAVAPNGDLFVSQPGAGKVSVVRSSGGDSPEISDYVSGLQNPHDIVFHTIGQTTYVYVSESDQVDRFTYRSGDTTAHDRQVVVSGLPDKSSPELKGSYRHELKNIALGPDDKLYVSLGSSCNACVEDTESDPLRGAIYQYDADGSNQHLFARGLRNAEGLAFVPGTNELWAVVNDRDNIAYPFDDSSGNYGETVPSYVDDHPPEAFTRIKDGGDYGWPFCNPDPGTESGLDDMPFDRDYELNADGHVDCNAKDRISKGIQAHSAPLGLTFLQDTNLPSSYRDGMATALHGSWNRQKKTGYKVIYFPWDDNKGAPGSQSDLVTGWLDQDSQEAWGRPVDLAIDQQGNTFISDDYSGTIYKLTYQGE